MTRREDQTLPIEARSPGMLHALRQQLSELANNEYAAVTRRFFKTGPGQYGEGDQFIGVRVPRLRALAKEHDALLPADAAQLLSSPIHEERLLSLLLLIRRYRKGDDTIRQWIYEVYLSNTRHINNWDLVDLSAEHIVGAHLLQRARAPLYRLVRSRDLWERRISILSTFCYIKRKEYDDTIKIAGLLLQDSEDLIHKAVGWMLREVGKRNLSVEEAFLKQHCRRMPRTMLRYAIEKFPEDLRQAYLKGSV